MTEQGARTLANAILATAAVVAAYYVVRTPRLRHALWNAGTTALKTTLPAYLLREVRQAWIESGHAA
ncbi:MAG: hypothetical protein HYX76_01340 [Acidobacteria bacterium]|nr:hypothetical protein [Acidobacteriota bacterium]